MNKDIEHCWFLYGARIGRFYAARKVYHSFGTSSTVDFDGEKVLCSKTFLGWIHTHPTGAAYPSVMDHQTMRSWVKATGKSYLCGITAGKEKKCFLFFRQGWEIFYRPVMMVLGRKWFCGHIDDIGETRVS